MSQTNSDKTMCWQNLSRDEKGQYLLQSGHIADCSFIVDADDPQDPPVTFKCHKFMLSLFSPVFERMFYGDYAESKSSHGIHIKDVNEVDFRKFLENIYCSKNILNTININSMRNLLQLAQIYMVDRLVDDCMDIIEKRLPSLNLIDLIRVFELAHVFENKTLITSTIAILKKDSGFKLKTERLTSCLHIFKLNAWIFYEFLKSMKEIITEAARFNLIELYAHISYDTSDIDELTKSTKGRNEVVEIKGQNHDEKFAATEVDCGETKVIQTETINSAESSENKKLEKFDNDSTTITLANMMQLINFNSMTHYEFCNGPGESELLTLSDKLAYLKQISNK